MSFQVYEELDHGITRIDTAILRDELAACYLVCGTGGQDGDQYAIIETGTHNTVPIILDLLQQRGIAREQLRYVIPTHVHLDHAGGVGGLMQALPEATLLVHPAGARHMIDPAKLKAGAMAVYGEAAFAEIYGDVIPVNEDRVRTMDDDESLMLGDRQLTFYDTPGHARHHFCIHDPLSQGIFTGDTFGLSYPQLSTDRGPFIMPTTTPVQFDPEAMKASIHKLLALAPERIYLTHYGMVENPQGLGERLLKQVDDYVALAEGVAGSLPASQRQDELTRELNDYLLQEIRKHGCTLPDERLKEILSMDINLNSQGLAIWLDSQAVA